MDLNPIVITVTVVPLFDAFSKEAVFQLESYK